MSVITISREFGSLGSVVAEKTAQVLGYRLADKNTIEEIFRDYGLPKLEGEYDSIPGFWDRFAVEKQNRRQTLFGMLNKAICAVAEYGNVVILGRGGFAVLAGLADVLHVRIEAPMLVRIKRLVDSPSIGDPARAEELILKNDQLQKTFIKSVYGQEWDSAGAFDLVIDTGKIAPELAADLIAEATRAMPAAGARGVRTTADLGAEKYLIAAVDDALNRPLTHAH
jgi:cytidylate kinase